MLRFLLGAAGSGKTKLACEEIRDRMGERDRMVLLTPEQQSHRAERILSAVCGPRLSLCGEVLSFTRMYNRAAVEMGGLADPLPDKGGRLLLMALALEEAGSGLHRFRERSRRSDFLSKLMVTAEELRAAMITPADLGEAAARASGAVREKLADMALVLETWEAVQLRQLGDSRDAVARLADGIGESTVGLGGVWVDGFTDFTARELSVLDGLLRRGTELTVTLPLGEASERDPQFSVAEETFRSLMELARRRGVETELVRLPDPPQDPIRYLGENLYRYEAPPLEQGKDAVELCHMDTFRGECRWAASRIRELMLEDPSLRFSDFAVAVPDFAARRNALVSVFREYGLPVFVEEAESLLPSAPAVCVLEALRSVQGGWRAREIFRLLKTGLAGLTPEETDELENYCLTWDLRGENTWRKEADWDLSPGGYDRASPEDGETLAKLNAFRRRIAGPLGKLGDAVRLSAPAGQLLRALAAFLEEIGIREALALRADALEREGDAAGATACALQWGALCDCLRQMDTVLGSVTLAPEELIRLLELLFREREVGAIPATLDCVSLGSPARLRGRKPRVLLVLGAEDERLPGESGAQGLFSPEEKRLLFDLGLRLNRDRDEELTRPLLELYLLVSSPASKLLVSWSGGEESRPSLLIERARALLGATVVTERSLLGRPLAAAPAPARLLALGEGPWAASVRACLPEEELAALRDSARQAHTPLGEETVRSLYGARLRLTPSRAETYYQCSYRYYLEYGLRARERKTARFSAPENGSFLHYVLENVCRTVRDEGGFASVEEARLRSLTREYARRFSDETFRPAQLKDKRFLYLFRRLCDTAETVVLELAEQLSAGDFLPLDFELSFSSREGDLPPLSLGDVLVEGKVDRVDGWSDGENLYLCVADYKSGEKTFRLSDVYRGLSIQMLVYLFMLTAEGEDRYARQVKPGGVLYLPARDKIVEAPRDASDEEVRLLRGKALKVSGLLLDDRALLRARDRNEPPRYLPVKFKDGVPVSGVATAARMGQLERYVRRLLTGMGEEIRRGEARPDPLFKTRDQGPCNYCPYGPVCGFDPKRTPPRVAGSMTDEEFWTLTGEEEAHG